jgi:hypothetical protein
MNSSRNWKPKWAKSHILNPKVMKQGESHHHQQREPHQMAYPQ